MLAVTRFNEITWRENTIWRQSRQYNGCIYNTPVKISKNIMVNECLFVFEMNNSINKIEGIGLIKNYLNLQNKYKIYSEQNYNRYTYKSRYRITSSDFTKEEIKLINVLEKLLFYGTKHMKRGQGIQAISSWIQYNNIFDFNNFIKNIFVRKFKESIT